MALDPAIAWSWALSIFTAYHGPWTDVVVFFVLWVDCGLLLPCAVRCCALGLFVPRSARCSRVVLVRAGRRTDDYPLRYLIAPSCRQTDELSTWNSRLHVDIPCHKSRRQTDEAVGGDRQTKAHKDTETMTMIAAAYYLLLLSAT